MSPRAARRRRRRLLVRLFVGCCFLFAENDRVRAAAAPVGEGSAAVHRSEIVARSSAVTVRVRATRDSGGKRQTSHGAGVVLSAEGVVVTALHVVRGFEQIQVSTGDGAAHPARILQTDEDWDLALLGVDAGRLLEAAVLAPPGRARSGDRAIVVGNPHGKGQSVAGATLGGFRQVRWDGRQALLQSVDGPIVKGNSGGGTFDERTGELLGVNVAKSSAKSNTGYMVPVDRLVAVLERKRLPIVELEESAEVYRRLGVRLRPVRLIDSRFSRGMLLTAVRPGSAADLAGWRAGDVLVGLDRYKMIDLSAVLYVIRETTDTSPVDYLVARGDAIDQGTIELRGAAALAASAARDEPRSIASKAPSEPVLAAAP